MADITRRSITVGHLRMHIAEAGSGPLVILLHGFPESSYSWRHQLTALADAGFCAVAPDQRGYGRTGGPADVSAYTICSVCRVVIVYVTAVDAGALAERGLTCRAAVAERDQRRVLPPRRPRRSETGVRDPFRVHRAAAEEPAGQ
ncbi:hypothetical protein Franean1_6641 [Parafrankia sp. EAN1pec]|nr:hypothetical protein Franean1_6641 [Frankia sp. EAN1pec]